MGRLGSDSSDGERCSRPGDLLLVFSFVKFDKLWRRLFFASIFDRCSFLVVAVVVMSGTVTVLSLSFDWSSVDDDCCCSSASFSFASSERI